MKLTWKGIGNIGRQYAESEQSFKSIRFLNYMSLVAVFLILLYAIGSLFQFHFKYVSFFFVEISFVFILLVILILNSAGKFNAAKILGVVCNIIYLFFLNIAGGNYLGGAYILLVTAPIPMILFNNKWLSYFFFALHLAAFFVVYVYYQYYPPLLEIAQKDIRSSYIAAVVVMFLTLFFIIQYFLNVNSSYEWALTDKNHLLNQKNKEILDSIEYAKRIQNAILPTPHAFAQLLPHSFILYMPKDIVAGDFYWMDSVEDTIFFAACDCTGHGVPGAMVSVVCNNALNRAVNEFGERIPGKILDKTRELVLENFERSDEEVHDGMDASLCALHTSAMQLQWSGANNPLWIYRSGSRIIEEVKPDKQAIGRGYEGKRFTTQELQLQKGDTLYLFTDGYVDQFGGEKGKKLTKARFREFLLSIAEMNMEQQREKLLNFHDAYRGPHEQVDDICVIGVRV